MWGPDPAEDKSLLLTDYHRPLWRGSFYRCRCWGTIVASLSVRAHHGSRLSVCSSCTHRGLCLPLHVPCLSAPLTLTSRSSHMAPLIGTCSGHSPGPMGCHWSGPCPRASHRAAAALHHLSIDCIHLFNPLTIHKCHKSSLF